MHIEHPPLPRDRAAAPPQRVHAVQSAAARPVRSPSSPAKRVLIAGAGLTGALAVRMLRRQAGMYASLVSYKTRVILFPFERQDEQMCMCMRLIHPLGNAVHITVWEMARGAGGRMSTTRWDDPGGNTLMANMGAQFISCGEDGASLIRELISVGKLRGPLTDTTPHSRCFDITAGYSDYTPVDGTSEVNKVCVMCVCVSVCVCLCL